MAIKSNNFNVDKNGNITCNNGKFTGGTISLKGGTEFNTNFEVKAENDEKIKTSITPTNIYITTDNGGVYINSASQDGNYNAYLYNDNYDPQLYLFGNGSTRVKSSGITTPTLVQTSLEEMKKNIKKFNNGFEIIRNSEIYTYNLKTEEDKDKKHIGFIIGEKYKTPKQVIAKAENGIDIYSMTSILWQAVKELIQEVEDLENKLEGGK